MHDTGETQRVPNDQEENYLTIASILSPHLNEVLATEIVMFCLTICRGSIMEPCRAAVPLLHSAHVKFLMLFLNRVVVSRFKVEDTIQECLECPLSGYPMKNVLSFSLSLSFSLCCMNTCVCGYTKLCMGR